MYMSERTFDKVAQRTLYTDNDIMNAFAFVEAILYCEAKAISEREPHATRGIEEFKTAAQRVYDLLCEFENGEFNYE